MEKERERIVLDALLRLLRSAVEEALRLRDAEAFLAWMQTEAPRAFPELFAGQGDQVARAVARELGRQVWNALPASGNAGGTGGTVKALPPEPLTGSLEAAPALPGLTSELLLGLLQEAPEEAKTQGPGRGKPARRGSKGADRRR